MTYDEAVKVARQVKLTVGWECGGHVGDLCDALISGDLKREIENAAYERAAKVAEEDAQRGREDLRDPSIEPLPGARVLAAVRIRETILSLIQPPAQKESGE